MKLISGLGNPGKQYKHTRHNIGFILLDRLRETRWLPTRSESKHRALTSTGSIDGHKVLLAKPLTFMNKSGESLASLMNYYDISTHDMCVIHDEIDLPVAQIKYKSGGWHAWHNGLRSIIDHSSGEFERIRVGIGRPEHPQQSVSDYVLSTFSSTDIHEIILQRENIYDHLMSWTHDWSETHA
jgi:PTH1 family peptidyl-tRNA hydrolase